MNDQLSLTRFSLIHAQMVLEDLLRTTNLTPNHVEALDGIVLVLEHIKFELHSEEDV